MIRIVWLGVLFALASCKWMSDDKGFIVNTSDDYVDVTAAPPLAVPADLDPSRIRDRWPIPDIEIKPLAQVYPKGAPRPDAIFGDEGADQVKIQKLGSRRWLLVGSTPSEAWPVLKQFLADNGVPIGVEDPTRGRIDTDWMTVKEDERDIVRRVIYDGHQANEVFSGRDRVKFRIEQGIRRGSAEIQIRVENDTLDDPADWPEFSMMNLVEAELLSELGAYFAAGVAGEFVSRVAQEVVTTAKAEIELDAEGYPQLRLNVDYERAWATVKQALRRASIEVVEIRRDEGVFFVHIVDDSVEGAASEGWFKRMIPGGTDGLDVEIRMTASDGSGEDAESYLVAVFGQEGDRVPLEVGQQILVILREFAT